VQTKKESFSHDEKIKTKGRLDALESGGKAGWTRSCTVVDPLCSGSCRRV
jgi:hypothetical protein